VQYDKVGQLKASQTFKTKKIIQQLQKLEEFSEGI